MKRYVVCRVDDLKPGRRKIIRAGGHSIGVFNVEGKYYALLNRCPHRGAPLCEGYTTGLVVSDEPYHYDIVRDGEILRCPWHGWEFDITNGRSIFNPHRVRVRSYEISVEPAEPQEPAVQSFPVTIEDKLLVVHV